MFRVKGLKSSSSGCLGALERLCSQFSWGCSRALTLSAKGGGDRSPEKLQECTRDLGPRGKGSWLKKFNLAVLPR